jgi:hypothetical protein
LRKPGLTDAPALENDMVAAVALQKITCRQAGLPGTDDYRFEHACCCGSHIFD